MKAAYIGILTPGSTSRMRAEWLRRLTPEWKWDWLDSEPPLANSSRAFQSLAYRIQRGAGVRRINEAVNLWLKGKDFDLIWVDKAIFLWPQTIDVLRNKTLRLVHFTPDTAFHANQSRFFEKSIDRFDLLITTKSFEVAEYRRRTSRDTVLLTTQGFDPDIHYPRTSGVRKHGVVFVGLAEESRENCLSELLSESVPVSLAGVGWKGFVRKHSDDPLLSYKGEYLFGEDYAHLLSDNWIGLGLLSKRFPELHTTRTFEIPACGAILATESNAETRSFFEEDEVIFFDEPAALARRLKTVLVSTNTADLEKLATKGRNRVVNDERDYPHILSRALSDTRIA